jgi:hypothetical protein
MKGFEQAQSEYESRLFNPYDYEYDEEEEKSDKEAYWAMVDAQEERMKLGEDW